MLRPDGSPVLVGTGAEFIQDAGHADRLRALGVEGWTTQGQRHIEMAPAIQIPAAITRPMLTQSIGPLAAATAPTKGD
jgi:hypothetical protein